MKKIECRVNLKRIIMFIALVLCYIIVWNVIVNYPVSAFILNSGNNGESIQISDSVGVVVMRYSILPVYWSEIGKLTTVHNIFTVLVTLACFVGFKETKKNVLGHAIAIDKLKGGESQ